jgi:hypothetical protein
MHNICRIEGRESDVLSYLTFIYSRRSVCGANRCEGKLALNLSVETLFDDYNNCSATIVDHIILHNHLTWALRYEEVKAPGPQPIW